MSHIPTYVYILFLVLLWMGVSRCYPRTIRVERLLILPALMIVLGVRGFLGLFPAPTFVDLAAALAGGAIGLAMGWRHAGRWPIRIDRSAQTIAIPGDVMMLAIILGVFVFRICRPLWRRVARRLGRRFADRDARCGPVDMVRRHVRWPQRQSGASLLER